MGHAEQAVWAKYKTAGMKNCFGQDTHVFTLLRDPLDRYISNRYASQKSSNYTRFVEEHPNFVRDWMNNVLSRGRFPVSDLHPYHEGCAGLTPGGTMSYFELFGRCASREKTDKFGGITMEWKRCTNESLADAFKAIDDMSNIYFTDQYERSVARLGYDLGIPAEKIRWEMNGIINKDRPSARDILLYSPEAVDIIKACLAREYDIYEYAIAKFNKLNLDPAFLAYETQFMTVRGAVKDCRLKFEHGAPINVCH
mmetsp:Transcript_3886/g.13778  ORF Transcript_3886/g.13778 Transcript_3886/m.13778 type:complete len:254 (+) Transcript_3886:458-1219(+)